MNYLLFDMLYNCFIAFGTLAVGTGLAVICVSMIYDFNNLEEEEEEKEEKEKELTLYQKICVYEQKYIDDFYQLEERKLTDNELKKLSEVKIEEETPLGPIIMTYDPKSESFLYYCDNKTLTYRMLDTNAQLFAIKYDCKQICVDYKKEWDKGKTAAIEQKQADEQEDESLSDEEQSEEEEKPIFAKFKSYNINKTRTQNSSKDSNKRYHIFTDKANRFTYKGRIDEFTEKEEAPPPKNNINFKEFKALLGRTT